MEQRFPISTADEISQEPWRPRNALRWQKEQAEKDKIERMNADLKEVLVICWLCGSGSGDDFWWWWIVIPQYVI